MNPEIKEKWLEALRSGKYAQTRYRLQRTKPAIHHPSGLAVTPEPVLAGFCCLGVLADVVGCDWEESLEPGCLGIYSKHHEDDGDDGGINIGDPPGEILEEAGLTFEEATHLMCMNDGTRNTNGQGWQVKPSTFAELADFIEEKF